MAKNPGEMDMSMKMKNNENDENNENDVSISRVLEAPLGPFSAVDLTIGCISFYYFILLLFIFILHFETFGRIELIF